MISTNKTKVNIDGGKLEVKNRNIMVLRFLLAAILLIAAAACSTAIYFLLSQNETKLFESQYKSISLSALNSVVGSFGRMNLGLEGFANTYGYIYPGFLAAATPLRQVSSLTNIAFSPIVLPEQLPQYEAFMRDYYLQDTTITRPEYQSPNVQVGMVWSFTANLRPYHDTTGVYPGRDRVLLIPAAQYTYSSVISYGYLGYNTYSSSFFGPVYDSVMRCTDKNGRGTANQHCGAISDGVPIPFPNYFSPHPEVEDVVAMLVHPIFAGDSEQLVGLASGTVSWEALLADTVPTFVPGMDCVIKTNKGEFTYSIIDGVPSFASLGDTHDRKYSKYRESRTLESNTIDATEHARYELSFYPRQSFADEYSSFAPTFAAVALVVVFFICAAVFIAYDMLVHRESTRKQAVLDTKRRFVRFISHEIRTPLNTVRLGLKLFESELLSVSASVGATPLEELAAVVEGAVDGWKQLIDDILSNSETAVEVLDDLLNYDKVEMGTLRLEHSIFNALELARKTTAIMQIQAMQKSIQLQLLHNGAFPSPADKGKGSASSSCMVGDVYRMGQVLRNLISNALKFTPSGGNVIITVENIPDGMPDASVPASEADAVGRLAARTSRAGSLRIAVKDSGAGLSPQQLEQICCEGVQFNANQLQAGQGSGLGLFISKGIIEQHGGKLTISSEGLGKGVTFTFEVPVYHEPQPGAFCDARSDTSGSTRELLAGCSASQAGTIATPAGPSLQPDATHHPSIPFIEEVASTRVLVVDDSPFNRKMLCRLLASKAYLCEQAEDGSDALKVYSGMLGRGQPPDIILMDFEMPVLNGPQATARLREMGCACLIVGVTGNVLPDEVAYFKQQGAQFVLPKPFVLEDFETLQRRHRAKTAPKPPAAVRTDLGDDHDDSAATPALTLSLKPGASARSSPCSAPSLLPPLRSGPGSPSSSDGHNSGRVHPMDALV